MAGFQLSDIPIENLGKFLIQEMRRYGDNIALIDGVTSETYTYNDVINRTERLAAGLQTLGVQKDDVVCIFAPNHMDYAICYYSTALVGAVLQPINPLYTAGDLSRTLKECGTKFIITTPELLPKVKEAKAGNREIKRTIVFGEAEGCIAFSSLLDPRQGRYITPYCDPKTSTTTLFSSSGTTGFPKAVQLSHYCQVANIRQMQYKELYKRDEALLVFLPMFHAYGLFILCATGHASGARIVVIPRFIPDQYLQLIQTYKPTTLTVVPPVMVMVAKHPNLSQYNLSSVKSIVCGAAPLSEEIEGQVKAKLSLEYIRQGYGMTEVLVTHLNTDQEFKHKAVGRLLPLVEMKIVDVDTEKPIVGNIPGEIWIRGPQTALGYLNLPAQTSQTFLPDGWVRTGDIGYEDEDGYMYIVDRLKELIKYKGFQVAPATLEDMLLRHEAVADVGVVGVPDLEAGELPRGFVVLKSGRTATEQELVDFVAGQTAPHMRLRGGIRFVEEIPRSLSGKILRRVLRDQVKSKL